MDIQKLKDTTNIIFRLVILLGLTAIIIIITWKLALSDLYFDFTNYTITDILIFFLVIFLMGICWFGFSKMLGLIDKKTEPNTANEDFYNKLLVLISEFINTKSKINKDAEAEFNNKEAYEDHFKLINEKLVEIISLLKMNPTNDYHETILNKSQTLIKNQNNNSNEHLNLILKKLISSHFELSTLKMLPLEIYEFRLKKIINELDDNTVNELMNYNILDRKKQLTEIGKTKFIDVSKSL